MIRLCLMYEKETIKCQRSVNSYLEGCAKRMGVITLFINLFIVSRLIVPVVFYSFIYLINVLFMF